MPVTELANAVFYGNGELIGIHLPYTLTKVGAECFVGCTSLTQVDLQYVTDIGASCFSGCINLTTVDSIASLTSIPAFLFNGCTSLETVYLGPGVTSIANNAFHTCEKLTTITTNGQPIPNSLPESLVNLGEAAFANCKKLTQVTFYGNVTEIKSDAFGNCELLSSVSFLGATPPSVGTNAFYGVASGARGHYRLAVSTAWTAALGLNPIPGLSFDNNDPSINSGGPYVAATIEDFGLEDAPASLPFTVGPTDNEGNQSEGRIAWNGTTFTTDSSIFLKSGKNTGGEYSYPELGIWGNVGNGNPNFYEGYGGVVGPGTMIGSAGVFFTEYNFNRLEFTGRRYLALVANGYYGYADVSVGGTGNTELTVHAVVFNTVKGQAIAAGVTPKLNQAITYTGLGNLTKAVGDPNFTLVASKGASSSPLVFSSSNPSAATITAAGSVTIVGAGSTTLSITQAGDATYNAAPSINVILSVSGSGGGTGGGTGGVGGGGLSQVSAPVLSL
ncbi:MAG: leucine-rich repeat domain-containing protein, partial [Verrucomicrobia bacterium]|nr:leucine-rich repeat domain-containing protein [Verrucomicrobiota bacterium]